MRDGTPLKNQMCETGTASSMCPRRSRRTLACVDLDAAALADDALEPDSLVLPAVALPVAGRAEDLLAEEPVLLRLEGAVVDGLGLLDLAVRPQPDVVGSREADTQLVEEVDVEQDFLLSKGELW